ncbi:MAG: alpha/beta fold hydrolase, partial [Desulfobacterota bacterium]|nr:alpha/beta fold hydrolase [Thermodesulfobacteriota bacterium]
MAYTRSILTWGRGLCVEHYMPKQLRHTAALLFVHGICHGSWVWWRFMEYFSSRGFACFAVNLRGHFLSSGHGTLGQATVDDYIDDVITCCNALSLPIVLIGHSMGGIVCQKVAEKIRVHKLILLDSAPCRYVTENYLSLDPARLELSRRAFVMLPDGTVYIDPQPAIVRKLLFEKDNVSEEALMQTVSLLGRESAAVAAQHGFVPIDPDKIQCPVSVLGRTGLG